MAVFEYKGFDGAGKAVSGVIDGGHYVVYFRSGDAWYCAGSCGEGLYLEVV